MIYSSNRSSARSLAGIYFSFQASKPEPGCNTLLKDVHASPLSRFSPRSLRARCPKIKRILTLRPRMIVRHPPLFSGRRGGGGGGGQRGEKKRSIEGWKTRCLSRDSQTGNGGPKQLIGVAFFSPLKYYPTFPDPDLTNILPILL